MNKDVVAHVPTGVAVTTRSALFGHEYEIVVLFHVIVLSNNTRMARKLPGYDVMDFGFEIPPYSCRAEL